MSDALRQALAEIAARAPTMEDSTHGRRYRCRACGYAWGATYTSSTERHDDHCAYVIARTALSAVGQEAEPVAQERHELELMDECHWQAMESAAMLCDAWGESRTGPSKEAARSLATAIRLRRTRASSAPSGIAADAARAKAIEECAAICVAAAELYETKLPDGFGAQMARELAKQIRAGAGS